MKNGGLFQAKVVDQAIILKQVLVDQVLKLRGKHTGHDFIRCLEEEHLQELERSVRRRF